MSKKCTKSQDGASNIGILLFILTILAGVFIGFQVMPFYYSYYELQGLMQSQADKGSQFKDEEITRVLKRAIKKLEIPADTEDLKINRFAGRIVIELNYSEVLFVDFGGGYDYDLWVFQFNPRGEAPL